MTLTMTGRLGPRSAAWPAWGGLVLLIAGSAAANNIGVTNVGLTKQDTVAKTANVVFDLAWENSWRDDENWDAAWVFVKFRAPGSNEWAHATLDTNSASHAVPANATNSAAPDGKGVFIYRSANYTGNVNYAGTKLKWNYGLNGCTFATGAVVEVSVHAVEMVSIPQGPFYVGSGGGEVSHFYQYAADLATTNPFLISSTNAIVVTNTAGNLYYDYSSYGGDQAGIISNSFPNGYAAFYCMKYEISQGQYANFLNKLATNQAVKRWPNKNNSQRHTISRNAFYYFSASVPDRACNYLSWADVSAYADWSALRPLTELEYEKACRGAAYPVSNEYAWGNTTLVVLTSEVGPPGSGTVTADPANANFNEPSSYSGFGGVARVGLFAARPGVTRALSGAGYYGAMELSGNEAERYVTVGTNVGRAFTGLHGDGMLTDITGDADVIAWPGTNAVGVGIRGGGYNAAPGPHARVSDRTGAALVDSERDGGGYGNRAGRVGRSAP